jgi:hypothetical protein
VASLLELSKLSNAVYGTPPAGLEGWACNEVLTSSGNMQAAAFVKGRETVLAFRGTTASASDVLADLKLGCGMNTNHFSAAEEFAVKYLKTEHLTLCGHSLGGAIAQIVGNRRMMKFATFNAPGVAVLASRNILDADPAMLALRIAGAAASVLRHPMQAARDVQATFNVVTGANIALSGDVVSQIGVHYGKVVRIPGGSYNPLSQHSIETVIGILQTNPVGMLGVENVA